MGKRVDDEVAAEATLVERDDEITAVVHARPGNGGFGVSTVAVYLRSP